MKSSLANKTKNEKKVSRNPSIYQEKTVQFFETTSAHGWDKIFGTKSTKLARIFWSIVVLMSVAGLIAMITTRITDYLKVSQETSFTTSIVQGENNTLEMPSISICSEGFITDFMLDDLNLILLDRLDFYYENPGLIFQTFLNYDSNYKFQNYQTSILYQHFRAYVQMNIKVYFSGMCDLIKSRFSGSSVPRFFGSPVLRFPGSSVPGSSVPGSSVPGSSVL